MRRQGTFAFDLPQRVAAALAAITMAVVFLAAPQPAHADLTGTVEVSVLGKVIDSGSMKAGATPQQPTGPVYSPNVNVAIDQPSYAVAIGQTLQVSIEVETFEEYQQGTHKYIGYFAYFSQGQWHQVHSWYIDGGVATYTMTMKISSWETLGEVPFVASVFPIDNTSEGASLADNRFTVNMLPAAFDVRLDANGGSCARDSIQATYGMAYGYLPDPVRDGYEFAGWHTMAAGGSLVTQTTTVTQTADHSLYAQWREIPKRDLAGATVELDVDSVTYSGRAHQPGVTVLYGAVPLTPGVDYDVSYSRNVNAGKAVVTVSGAGRYEGSREASFTIEPASIEWASLALSKFAFAYNGKVQQPAVSVTLGAKELVKGADYEVSYPGQGAGVGTYAVRVAGSGNYEGSLSATFRILPAPSKIKSAKGLKGGAKISWKAVAAQCSGYEIYLSTSKKFSIMTTKRSRFASASAVGRKCSFKGNGLKRRTTYYAKIRTYYEVSGQPYYSEWSAVKALRTK